MLWSAIGDEGWTALGIAALALPIQVAIASMLAMGRRVPAAASLLMPTLVLTFGLVGVVRGFDDAIRALRHMPDPAYAPWFAIVDRARAAAPIVPAAWAATALLVIPAVGASLGGLREPKRGFVGPLLAASAAMFACLGLVGAGMLTAPSLAVPGLVIGALGLSASGAAAATRPMRGTTAATGISALAMGAVAMALAGAGGRELSIAALFPDLDAPFDAFPALGATLDEARRVDILLVATLSFAVLGALPGMLFVRPRVLDAASGLDLVGVSVAFVTPLLGTAWALARRHALTRLAGVYAVAVLDAGPGYDVPRVEVVPPRVFVASTAPVWLALRDGGGVEKSPLTGDINGVSESIRRGDALALPPTMEMLDAYLLLAGADVGAISLVGCGKTPASEREKIASDPLRAVGLCGAIPVRLRVVENLTTRRTLIALKDREFDDGGDIVALADLANVDGNDVVLRAQADATVADLVAALRALRKAHRVYLGWGVDLDGSDIAVGVNPDLWVDAG